MMKLIRFLPGNGRAASPGKPAPLFRVLAVLGVLAMSQVAWADTPLGWINSQNPTAYTANKGEISFSLSGLQVNDTIDFLNVRDDLLAGDRRLIGNSGDLDGQRFELHFGITDWLSAFYEEQRHGIRIDFGEINSVNVLDIDRELETTARTYGLRWMLYESNLLEPGGRKSALSLELRRSENKSENFDVVADELRIDNLILSFRDPATFSVTGLQDEGWEGRLLFSRALLSDAVATVWLGYKDSETSAATSAAGIDSVSITNLFAQTFTLDEDYFSLGASLNLQINPRLPVLLSYSYLHSNSSTFSRTPEDPIEQLPGFLRGGAPRVNSNHTLFGRIAYWITPELNVAVTGNLYSNQFLGILPHYSNPLSESFADNPYGYAGVELTYSLRGLSGFLDRQLERIR